MNDSLDRERCRFAVLATVIASLAFAAPAFAEDGVYVGTVTFGAVQATASQGAMRGCPATGDMKITVTGTKIEYVSLSGDRRATGIVDGDGKFTASGTYAVGPSAANIVITGRVDHTAVTGDYAANSRTGTCAGTIAAQRQ